MKTPVLEESVVDTLKQVLSDVSWLDGPDVKAERSTTGRQPELVVTLDRPDGKTTLLVEVKSNGEPRHVRDAINSVLRRLVDRPNTYALIAAPYISEGVGTLCREEGVGYLDLAGNCFISAPGLHIVVSGRPRPASAPREPRTLFAPKSSRVLRTLFAFPKRRWRLAELAQAAGVSLGQVANVKKALEDKEWARTTKDGLLVTKPELILRAWAAALTQTDRAEFRFFTLADSAEVEKGITEYCLDAGLPCAFTAFSAGYRMAPMVNSARVTAYLLGDLQPLIPRLGLKKADDGANVVLLVPKDNCVLLYSSNSEGIPIVSPVQAYLDLSTIRGRGREAADAIMQRVILQQW